MRRSCELDDKAGDAGGDGSAECAFMGENRVLLAGADAGTDVRYVANTDKGIGGTGGGQSRVRLVGGGDELRREDTERLVDDKKGEERVRARSRESSRARPLLRAAPIEGPAETVRVRVRVTTCEGASRLRSTGYAKGGRRCLRLNGGEDNAMGKSTGERGGGGGELERRVVVDIGSGVRG
jgi:hypothetical protein